MSSSEPRLTDGEGPPGVRPVVPGRLLPESAADQLPPPPGTPPLDQPPPEVEAADLPGVQYSAVTSTTPTNVGGGPSPDPAEASRKAESARGDDLLPPLISTGDFFNEAPPWLLSAVLHMSIMIVLGLFFVAQEQRSKLLLRFDYSDHLSEQISEDNLDVSLNLAERAFEAETLSPEPLEQLPSTTVVSAPPLSAPVGQELTAIRQGLSGREEGMREALLEAYGGTSGTQQAVWEGLRWLARNQGKGGMWSLDGRYADGASTKNPEVATALALLAFQGAGYTPASNPKDEFTSVVARGWQGLLEKEDEDGNFFHTGRNYGRLYTQAICTIAICELFGMTQDEQYREPAQRAIDYCVRVQAPEGGWRYSPGSGSDLSVTGWFVMALQSARMAGLVVPSPTLAQVSTYLDSVSLNGGSHYSYQPEQGASNSMTAEGLLCRQYLGWYRKDPRLQRGANYLVRWLPSWKPGERNIYYWYYATQVCHHMEGRHWRQWNETMREVIPAHQVREGRERGSWDPQGHQHSSSGGRLFVTCLSLYTLEVYYRHLPIYQSALIGQ